jgi:hypothetical protein
VLLDDSLTGDYAVYRADDSGVPVLVASGDLP